MWSNFRKRPKTSGAFSAGCWAGVERRCLIGTTETVEQRYFINSIPARAQRFATAVRGHWGVENRLHWRLDVQFNEDASRIRKGHAPAIMTTIRYLAMNRFEQEASKLRLSQKRRKAAWNDDYRANVVFSGCFIRARPGHSVVPLTTPLGVVSVTTCRRRHSSTNGPGRGITPSLNYRFGGCRSRCAAVAMPSSTAWPS